MQAFSTRGIPLKVDVDHPLLTLSDMRKLVSDYETSATPEMQTVKSRGDKLWHNLDGHWPRLGFQNSKGKRHREDGPAYIEPNRLVWFDEDEYLCEKTLACVRWFCPQITCTCIYRSELHRVDGPAVSSKSGREEWFFHGRRHRTNGPAVSMANGTQKWYRHGLLHRADGPAVVMTDGTEKFYVEGKRVLANNVPSIEPKAVSFLA